MELLKKALSFVWENRTKTLGFIQVTVAAIASQNGLFDANTLKWYIFVNGLLTSWVGFFNSAKTRQ